MKVKLLLAMVALVAMTVSASAQNGVIKLDAVTNEYTSTQLRAGSTHQISVRYDLTNPLLENPIADWYGTNAFELYSPDGADWGYMSVTTGPLVDGLPGSVIKYQYYYQLVGTTWSRTSNNGADPCPGASVIDRAGYYLTTLDFSGNGYVVPSEGIALIFEFETLVADSGLTMCFDSLGHSMVAAWEWAAASMEDFPVWDNGLGLSEPRCWEIYYVDPSDVTPIGTGNLPTRFDLNQNYPNPFNPVTTINFDLPKRAMTTLTVYNILGQKVATLVDEELAANTYEVEWNGFSDGGNQVASGIYFYRLTAGEKVMTKKMVLLK